MRWSLGWPVLAGLVALGCGGGGGEADAGPGGDARHDGAVEPDASTDAETEASDGSGNADADEARDAAGNADADAGAGPDADPPAPGVFRVITINLKHPLTGMGEAVERLQIVADTITARQPDVVALQEVVRDGDEPSFAEQLGTLTSYEWHWNFTYAVPFLFDEGIGVLSRWPIVWTDAAELPHVDLVLFTRQVLGARVETPEGEVQLFCSHMTTADDETVKADQGLAVYEFIQSNPSPLPGFFAGDLNAEPDSLAMRFLRGEAEHEGITGTLVDAWAAANPAEDGFTMASNDPSRRIDYIYVAPDTAGRTAAVVGCELLFTEPVDGLYASDHLGVLCDFTLP